MKRQSKAEEALTKQVKLLNLQIADLEQAQAHLVTKIETKISIRVQLQDSIDALKSARLEASERNKP